MKSSLKIGVAQIAPVFLNREATAKKILAYIADASSQQIASFEWSNPTLVVNELNGNGNAFDKKRKFVIK